MPTNLPPEARAKWVKVMEAKSIEEKIRALEEFISAVPKHKGTENLLLWARRRLRQLREEAEERKRKKGGRGPRFFIEKEGAAQVVLLGPPNSGKTTLLSKLTRARAVIREYPYSTTEPTPGMLDYMDIQFQLIDTPSLPFGLDDKVSWFNRVIGIARNSDCVALVIDSSWDPVKQLKDAVKELEDNGIVLRKPKCRVTIEKTSSGGINVIVNGRIIDGSIEDVKKMLREYRIHHAIVRVIGETSLDDIEAAILSSTVYKPSIVIANKIDLVRDEGELKKLEHECKLLGIPLLKVSARTGRGLDLIGKTLFETLDLIRIYTKQPNGDVAEKPLVLKRGATVLDVARSVHSRLAEHFRYARVWGKSVKYPGQRVGAEHQLEDGDIVEIYSKI